MLLEELNAVYSPHETVQRWVRVVDARHDLLLVWFHILLILNLSIPRRVFPACESSESVLLEELHAIHSPYGA